MQWGEHLPFLLQKAEDDGEVPEALANQPELSELLSPYLEAFFTLSAARPVGMAPGGIPASEIVVVAELYGLPAWECLYLCRAMDGLYLDTMAERQDKQKRKQTPPTNGNRTARTRH